MYLASVTVGWTLMDLALNIYGGWSTSLNSSILCPSQKQNGILSFKSTCHSTLPRTIIQSATYDLKKWTVTAGSALGARGIFDFKFDILGTTIDTLVYRILKILTCCQKTYSPFSQNAVKIKIAEQHSTPFESPWYYVCPALQTTQRYDVVQKMVKVHTRYEEKNRHVVWMALPTYSFPWLGSKSPRDAIATCTQHHLPTPCRHVIFKN